MSPPGTKPIFLSAQYTQGLVSRGTCTLVTCTAPTVSGAVGPRQPAGSVPCLTRSFIHLGFTEHLLHSGLAWVWGGRGSSSRNAPLGKGRREGGQDGGPRWEDPTGTVVTAAFEELGWR